MWPYSVLPYGLGMPQQGYGQQGYGGYFPPVAQGNPFNWWQSYQPPKPATADDTQNQDQQDQTKQTKQQQDQTKAGLGLGMVGMQFLAPQQQRLPFPVIQYPRR